MTAVGRHPAGVDHAQRYTTSAYAHDNPGWHAEDAPWKADAALRLIRAHGLAPRGVAEVGCGTGEVLRRLAGALPSAERLDGYDIAPDAIRRAEPTATPRVRFHCADYLGADTPPADLVLVLDVVEHVRDYFGFLERLRAKGQRHTLLGIPLEASVFQLLYPGAFARSRAAYGHLHHFVAEQVLATLDETGYRVVGAEYVCGALRTKMSPGNLALWLPRWLAYRLSPRWGARLWGGSLYVLAE